MTTAHRDSAPEVARGARQRAATRSSDTRRRDAPRLAARSLSRHVRRAARLCLQPVPQRAYALRLGALPLVGAGARRVAGVVAPELVDCADVVVVAAAAAAVVPVARECARTAPVRAQVVARVARLRRTALAAKTLREHLRSEERAGAVARRGTLARAVQPRALAHPYLRAQSAAHGRQRARLWRL